MLKNEYINLYSEYKHVIKKLLRKTERGRCR